MVNSGQLILGSLAALWLYRLRGKGEGGVGDLKQGRGCEFGKQSPELKRSKSTHALIADGDAVTSGVHLDGFRY
jgi:hypothetical protein